jgi:hypothetical protein
LHGLELVVVVWVLWLRPVPSMNTGVEGGETAIKLAVIGDTLSRVWANQASPVYRPKLLCFGCRLELERSRVQQLRSLHAGILEYSL